MDASLLNSLLHHSESETLDFKRDQYPFKGADKDAKSELLKDILAMANAWKSGDGHILVGVAEKTGNKAVVVGVTDHIDDATLQQFVNGKTNRPVAFGYVVVTVDGKQVGAITVAVDQTGPIFLKRDFGKRSKNVVYIRRGSSTAEANPDEIADMGEARASVAGPPSIELEFADPATHTRLGREVEVTSLLLVDPPPPTRAEIRKLISMMGEMPKAERTLPSLRIDAAFLNPLGERRPTPEELRDSRQVLALHHGIGFWVRNAGAVTAEDVRVVIHGTSAGDLNQMDEIDHPKNRREYGLAPLCSDLKVNQHGDSWTVNIKVGKLQPQSEVWVSDLWYVGAFNPLRLDLRAKIFADNLPAPVVVPLVVRIATGERVYHARDFEECDDD